MELLGLRGHKIRVIDYDVEWKNNTEEEGLYKSPRKVFKEYKKQQRQYAQTITNHTTKDEKDEKRRTFLNNFKIKAELICPNAEDLCNIVLDIAYKGNSKQFAWDICGEQIIKNLLEKNGNKYTYPMMDENGDIEYKGYKFSMREVRVCEE